MKRKLAVFLVVLMFLSFSISSVVAFVPPGLAKKGGLPPGIQKRFLDKDWQKCWKDDWKDIIQDWEKLFRQGRDGKEIIGSEYWATIQKIDTNNRRIMIQEGTAYLYLLVADNAKIQEDGKNIKLSNLSIGDEVYLKLNKDHTITEIKLVKDTEKDEENRSIKEAKVESINYETRRITLAYDNTRSRYILHDNTTIRVNGTKRDFNYIEVGMKVDVTIKDGKISQITVLEKTEELEGKLIDKYSNSYGTYILVEIDDSPVIFYVDEDLRIPTKLMDEEVCIKIKDDVVIDIWEKVKK